MIERGFIKKRIFQKGLLDRGLKRERGLNRIITVIAKSACSYPESLHIFS